MGNGGRMAKHVVRLDVDEAGHGRVLLDGRSLNAMHVVIEAGVNMPTKVQLTLINVEVRSMMLDGAQHRTHGRRPGRGQAALDDGDGSRGESGD